MKRSRVFEALQHGDVEAVEIHSKVRHGKRWTHLECRLTRPYLVEAFPDALYVTTRSLRGEREDDLWFKGFAVREDGEETLLKFDYEDVVSITSSEEVVFK